ncbi:MAG: aminotransferase class III-fold pyridoxal phosphate-dependent enzyme, partial [Gammaproteobacteria bacterium]
TALATLDIFEQDNILENNQTLVKTMRDATQHFADHPHIAEIRQHGMILAIELVQDKATRRTYPWQERRGLRVCQHALTQGVLLRPLGDVIYFMPPYVITADELKLLADVTWQGIDLATQD